MITRWLRAERVSYIDPLHAGRHPFQTYIFGLCIISSVPALFGIVGAASIEAELPYWLALGWNLALLVGATVGLLGSYWPGDYTNALTIERTGLAIVGSAAVVYAVVIIVSASPDRIIQAAITFGFGLACIRRARDIGHIIQTALSDLRAKAAQE